MSEALLIDLSRRRVVWTAADKKHMDRAAKVLVQHGDTMQLRCGNRTCPERTIRGAEEATGYKGRVLRCGCTDRVVEGRPTLSPADQARNAEVAGRAELKLLLPRLKALGVDGLVMEDGTTRPTKGY